MQHAARRDVGAQVGIGRMQRTRDYAVPLALAVLAQVDEGNAGLADEVQRLGAR